MAQSAKVQIRMQQIARLRVAGVKDAVIAASVGLTPAGLARIVALDEFKDLQDSILHGTISKMDQALAGKADLIKQQFREGVPLAMRTLLETVTQRRDLRAAMAAASEILDRDPDGTLLKAKDKSAGDGVPANGGLSDEQIKSFAAHGDAVAKETVQ